MATIYASLKNQCKFKYHKLFSASFYKSDEEDQRSKELKILLYLNKNQKITKSDINDIDVNSQWEHQLQIEETKENGWIFDKITWRKSVFVKTGDASGSFFMKLQLRSCASVNFKNDDKNCFLWSILAYLHSCESDHPNRVSNYRQYFIELNIEGFDYSNGFKCSDIKKLSENTIYLLTYLSRSKLLET